jgi:acyl-homoserine-lactone acylase
MPRPAAPPRPRALAAVALAALGAAAGCAAAPRPPAAGPTAASAAGPAATSTAPAADVARWERRARGVTITRDTWGIPHVRAATDADAVFGLLYAQAEDDFPRVESNYLTALGRRAEAEGESAVYEDLRQRLFVHDDTLRAQYARSPAWLRALMDGFADGLNYYLHTHPAVRPRAIARFEPWMALAFSEGSIGGDVERVSVRALEAFYGPRGGGAGPAAPAGDDDPGLVRFVEPSGSNGIAIAPANTRDGRALLLINPHTTFFFRAEAQVTSGEGLNAYGAVTWGQFFVYQGFNERVGWMHTTSGADAVDEFVETVTERGGRPYYRHGAAERPVGADTVRLRVRAPGGGLAERAFAVYRTHHGPVVRAEGGRDGGRWVSVALMQRPVEALSQSFLRTKARDWAEYQRAMALQANSSNNTLFASAAGDVAFVLPQFVPRRDDRFDYTRPVDGSDPAADWRGVHAPAELPQVVNPRSGFVYNTNNWPFTASGPDSPRRAAFPRYVDTFGENPRGVHARLLLEGRRGWTLESLLAAAYDPYLPAFADLVPPLVAAWDALPASDPARARLAEPVAALRGWDRRWAATSVPTALAVFWGEALWARSAAAARAANVSMYDYMAARTAPAEKLAALDEAVGRLTRDFGTWRTPWGEINRFQRRTGALTQPFSDAAPSVPVPFTSAQWGSLASFGARAHPGTRRYYGTSGNSFVAVVEFGPRVRARAVMAGGQSGDPRSPHFADQAARYAAGDLREVYFYPEQLAGHTERTYRPGG